MPSTSSEVSKVTKFGGTLFITFADGSRVEALSTEKLKRQIDLGEAALDLDGELELARAAEDLLVRLPG